MFNVTFYRLSFAPDLKNMPEVAGRVLSRIVNSSRLSIKIYSVGIGLMDDSLEAMASDILQLVVDMPEDEDLIWQAYQDEEPNDDEEVARMMAANEVS